MQRLWFEDKHRPTFAARKLNDYRAVANYFLAGELSTREVIVRRGKLDSAEGTLPVFFKEYRNACGWRFWCRASKARREFENYAVFASLQIPAAERVACGEERNPCGILKRAFIITRAVPHAVTLVEFFRRTPRPSREDRHHVCRQLAVLTRRLHTAGFCHHDLVWRNILVAGADRPRLWLIDCPRGAFARLGRARKQLRDLASLDKSAVKFCTRSERMRFLLGYLGKTRLDDEARRLARRCLSYRRQRWPEDWTGK